MTLPAVLRRSQSDGYEESEKEYHETIIEIMKSSTSEIPLTK